MRKVLVVLTMLVVVAGAALAVALVRGDGDSRQASPTGAFPNSPVASTPVFSPPADPVAASPTQPAVPSTDPPTRGSVSTTCVEGWVTPPRSSPMFTDPLGVIRRTAPVKGELVVVDMRLFVGPESPPSVGESAKGYLQIVRRWYVKLYATDELSYQGRFLVEQRAFGKGVSAVAPYDTGGFSSPDWVGFQYDSAKPLPRIYPGLPGRWRGEAYDFAIGGGGLTNPGLPDEVVGCMKGT